MEKTFAKRYWPTIVGAIVGAIGGYLYWRYVGCSTDTCPITSSPLNSTLWGTAMGGLLGNILQPNIIKKNNQNARQARPMTFPVCFRWLSAW